MNHHEFLALQTHIRHRIDELQALVEQRSDTLAEARSAAPPEAATETELGLKFAEKDKQELARLQANLVWLASDSGGCCAQCGRDIPVARLRAVPVTRLCIDCASSGE